MKFLVVNSFHRDDKGDAALLHVLIDQLRTIDPNADISVASMEKPEEYPDFYKARNVGSFELYSSSHVHPNSHLFYKVYIFAALFIVGMLKGRGSWLLFGTLGRVYREVVSADLVVSVGGGYFITKRDWGSYMHLLFALQTLLFAKRLGRTVVTAPVSVGPFAYAVVGAHVARVLKKLDLVLLREDISANYFLDSNKRLPANVRRAPDSGFAFEPEGSFDLQPIAGAHDGEKVLVLSVRNWMTKAKQDIYEQGFADLIDYLADKHPDIRPVFVPQCTFPYADDDDDRIVARRIMEKSKTKCAVVIENELDYMQVKLGYASADFVIGTRFHAMVFGLSYFVPGIAVEYEHKTRGIMRELGLETWVIRIGDVTGTILVELFEKLLREEREYTTYLQQKMPEYIQSTNTVIDLFRKEI